MFLKKLQIMVHEKLPIFGLTNLASKLIKCKSMHLRFHKSLQIFLISVEFTK